MPDELEEQFHRAMIAVYQKALRDCTERAAYYLKMVGRKGGVETARTLLQSADVELGPAALWECDRPDLLFERLILQPQYAALFTDDEKETARRRLEKYRYSL